MSRIGISPVKIPEGVTVNITNDNTVEVKGKLGEIAQKVDPDMKVEVNGDNEVIVSRPTEQKRHKSMHGLYRAIIANMVHGVSEGFRIKQEFVGVGYRAESKGQILQMSIGYSHDIHFEIPKEVKVEAVTEKRSNPVVTLTSHNKQLLGQVAAKLRSLRPPEPYKGKGIKFVGENIRKKAGKAANVK
ncbi:MAG: 50S ribosomal protein L6 [Bacteroidetes bacterium]|jgi:large subunit ribosomal protein L6|nr:50S ribosomal protein L6 [Bacteroidota bacterium]